VYVIPVKGLESVLFAPAARMPHIHGASSKDRKLFVEWYKHKGIPLFCYKFFRHQYPWGLDVANNVRGVAAVFDVSRCPWRAKVATDVGNYPCMNAVPALLAPAVL
jgi:hypothetical protein